MDGLEPENCDSRDLNGREIASLRSERENTRGTQQEGALGHDWVRRVVVRFDVAKRDLRVLGGVLDNHGRTHPTRL